MFHRCYECPALQTERDMYVSQEVRVAARAVGSRYREQFAHGIFPDPGAILPTGFPERECQVFWHNRPPDGLLEGHIFTDGSSSGSGALRRAGWAVVAVDDAGNLNAAAYGAVPSDVLPGQSARDGEDYAAALAGQFTLDPLTLYIDCAGTIATINGPKHKALGAQGPRAHVWNRLLFSHDEVRAVKVKGHATERDVEAGRTSHLCKRGNDFADTFAKKKGQICTSPLFASPRQLLLVRPWPSKRHVGRPKRTFCSGSGGGTTPGLLRHDHGYGPRERDSSESGRRRLLRRLQVRFLTGFLSFFPHASRKTVTSTLAHSEGTDEFSMLEAELWTTPSSFAPSVERSTGSVRMLSAANAANFQGAERRSCAN